eukprot:COSAG05_NODE_750_length_7545_cov_22.231265_4_plen_89_part_00
MVYTLIWRRGVGKFSAGLCDEHLRLILESWCSALDEPRFVEKRVHFRRINRCVVAIVFPDSYLLHLLRLAPTPMCVTMLQRTANSCHG